MNLIITFIIVLRVTGETFIPQHKNQRIGAIFLFSITNNNSKKNKIPTLEKQLTFHVSCVTQAST